MRRILTHSGAVVDLEDIPNADIRLIDISFGLSNITRWAGQLGGFTVAEHSALVAHMLRHRGTPLRFLGLIHDATESYLGELPREVKRYCPEYVQLEVLLYARIEQVLTKTYLPHLEPYLDSARNLELVEKADRAAAVVELYYAGRFDASNWVIRHMDDDGAVYEIKKHHMQSTRYLTVTCVDWPQWVSFTAPVQRKDVPSWEATVFDVFGPH